MLVIRAIEVGERESEVLVQGAEAQVFGIQVDQREEQGGRAVLAQLPAPPQGLLLHTAPRRAYRTHWSSDPLGPTSHTDQSHFPSQERGRGPY